MERQTVAEARGSEKGFQEQSSSRAAQWLAAQRVCRGRSSRLTTDVNHSPPQGLQPASPFPSHTRSVLYRKGLLHTHVDVQPAHHVPPTPPLPAKSHHRPPHGPEGAQPTGGGCLWRTHLERGRAASGAFGFRTLGSQRASMGSDCLIS